MKLVLDALKFGDERHAGQVRKASGDAYITHPLAVSYLLAAYKPSKMLEFLICACILHDVLEDTETTYEELVERFGKLVASLVLELTNDPAEIARLGKLEYHKAKLLGLTSWALVIKLCDRLHNVSDSPSEKMVQDTLELINHLEANRKLSRSQTALVEQIRSVCKERAA